MGFVVKIIPKDHTDIRGYYLGKLHHYRDEEVIVPVHTEDLHLAKVYKHRKRAENAMNKILNESSFVSICEIEEVV